MSNTVLPFTDTATYHVPFQVGTVNTETPRERPWTSLEPDMLTRWIKLVRIPTRRTTVPQLYEFFNAAEVWLKYPPIHKTLSNHDSISITPSPTSTALALELPATNSIPTALFRHCVLPPTVSTGHLCGTRTSSFLCNPNPIHRIRTPYPPIRILHKSNSDFIYTSTWIFPTVSHSWYSNSPNCHTAIRVPEQSGCQSIPGARAIRVPEPSGCHTYS